MIIATNDLTELAQRVWGSFLGRCVQRFLAMTGIDRCLMLSSQAFTALIPLLILASTLSPAGQDAVTHSIIRKFGLEGDSAASVEDLFHVPSEATGGLSLFSALLLVASGTSFTRRLQRMYRSAWGLEKVGVRSGMYATLGLFVLMAEVLVLYAARALVRTLPLNWLLTIPVSLGAGVVLWTSIPYLLLDRRVHWRRLLAGGVVAAIASSAYSVATVIYMPDLVQRYTSEFGLFGITIAIIGWLLAIAAILVASAAIGAEFDASHGSWVLALKSRFGLEDPMRARPTPSEAELAAGLNAEDFFLFARVLTSWLVLGVAVWVATLLVPGISVPGGLTTYLLVSLVLGLVNAVLGAVPILVELPMAPLSVGLAALVVNAVLLGFTAAVSGRLDVENFGSAFMGALVISVVASGLELLRRPHGHSRPRRPPTA